MKLVTPALLNTPALAAIRTTVETQFEAARAVLFAPFAPLPRYHGVDLDKAHERAALAERMGHACKAPRFMNYQRRDRTTWDALPMPAIGQILRLEDIGAQMQRELDPAGPVDIVPIANVVECRCEASGEAHTVYSVRVSIQWAGRLMSREYLLPSI